MAERHSAAFVVRLADPPSSPGPSLAGLWRPYVYRGLGFDIYDPDEEDPDLPEHLLDRCGACGYKLRSANHRALCRR